MATTLVGHWTDYPCPFCLDTIPVKVLAVRALLVTAPLARLPEHGIDENGQFGFTIDVDDRTIKEHVRASHGDDVRAARAANRAHYAARSTTRELGVPDDFAAGAPA